MMVPCCVCSKPVSGYDGYDYNFNHTCSLCSVEVYKLEYPDQIYTNGVFYKDEIWNKHIATTIKTKFESESKTIEEEGQKPCCLCNKFCTDHTSAGDNWYNLCKDCTPLFDNCGLSPETLKNDHENGTAFAEPSRYYTRFEEIKKERPTEVKSICCSTCGTTCNNTAEKYRTCSSCEKIFSELLGYKHIFVNGRGYSQYSQMFDIKDKVEAIKQAKDQIVKNESLDKDKPAKYGVWYLTEKRWYWHSGGEKLSLQYSLSLEEAQKIRSRYNAAHSSGSVFQVRSSDGTPHLDELDIRYNIWNVDSNRWVGSVSNILKQIPTCPEALTFDKAQEVLKVLKSTYDGVRYLIKTLSDTSSQEIKKDKIMTVQDFWVNDFYVNGGVHTPIYSKISIPCSCPTCGNSLKIGYAGDRDRAGYFQSGMCSHANDYGDVVKMRTDNKPKEIDSQETWVDKGFINPKANSTSRYIGICQKISIPTSCPCCSKKIVSGTNGNSTSSSGILSGCEHTKRYSDIVAMRTDVPNITFYPAFKDSKSLRPGMKVRCRIDPNEGFFGSIKSKTETHFTIDWNNGNKSTTYELYNASGFAPLEKTGFISVRNNDRIQCFEPGSHYLHRGTVTSNSTSQIEVIFDDRTKGFFSDSSSLSIVASLNKETIKTGMRVRCIYQNYTTTNKIGIVSQVRDGKPTIEWEDGSKYAISEWAGPQYFEECLPEKLSWKIIYPGLKIRLDLPNHSRNGKTAIVKEVCDKTFSILFEGEGAIDHGWAHPDQFITTINEAPKAIFDAKTKIGTRLRCKVNVDGRLAKIAKLVNYDKDTESFSVKWEDGFEKDLWSEFKSFELVETPNISRSIPAGTKLVCNTNLFNGKMATLVKIDEQGFLHIKWDDGKTHSTIWMNNGFFDIVPEVPKKQEEDATTNIANKDVLELLDTYIDTIKTSVAESSKPKEIRPASRTDLADAVINLLQKHAYPFGGFIRDKIANVPFVDLDLFTPRHHPNYQTLSYLDIVNILAKSGLDVKSAAKTKPIYASNRIDKLSNSSWVVTDPVTGYSFGLDLVQSSASTLEKDNPFVLLDADINSLYQDKDGNILAAPYFDKQEVIKNIKTKKFVPIKNAATDRLNKLIKKGYAQIKEDPPLVIEPKMTMEAKKKEYQVGDQFDIEISWESGDKTTLRRATCIDPKFKMEGSDESTMLVMLDKAFASTEAASQEIFSQYVDTATSLGIDYSGKSMWFIDEKTRIIPSNKKVKDLAKMIDPDDLAEGDIVELEIMNSEGTEPFKTKATVLNIDYDDSGELLCFLDSPYVSKEDDVSSFVLSDKENKERAKQYGFKPGAKRAWLIDENTNVTKRVATLSKNQQKEEGKTMSEGTFMEQFKTEGEEALYRVASTQMTKGVQAALLSIFKDKGMEDSKLNVIKEMFETEIGRSIISLMLGHALPYAPVIKDDPRVQRVATEFRIGGMAVIGNEVVGLASAYLLPAISDAMKSLPSLTETAQETLAPAMKGGKKKLAKKPEPMETPALEEVLHETVASQGSASATH